MSGGAHIVTTGFAPWDAISNHVLEEQRVLRSRGLRSEIFADPRFVHPDLAGFVHPAVHWERLTRPGDIAILHYSIASDSIAHVHAVADVALLAYHNITPAELLWRWTPDLARVCHEGRRTLAGLAGQVAGASADSTFNAEELAGLGFAEPAVVGILRPELSPSVTTPDRHPSRRLELLFVGRGVPNKAIHHLVMAVHALSDVGRDVHLTHIGSWGGAPRYERYCRDLARWLGVTSNVTFAGSVSDDEMVAAYQSADVFVCLSDHEGFCVPIVEAMQYGLPIVAYASSAIPWTAGDAALLLDEKSPSLVAEAIMEVNENPALRERMASGRVQRLAFHSREAVSDRLMAHLERFL